MDDRFAALANWHDFFAAVAGVAATLVGLLFVALALNPAVMANQRHSLDWPLTPFGMSVE